jgi:hypothetical protein
VHPRLRSADAGYDYSARNEVPLVGSALPKMTPLLGGGGLGVGLELKPHLDHKERNPRER